jgi:hypothetical protein
MVQFHQQHLALGRQGHIGFRHPDGDVNDQDNDGAGDDVAGKRQRVRCRSDRERSGGQNEKVGARHAAHGCRKEADHPSAEKGTEGDGREEREERNPLQPIASRQPDSNSKGDQGDRDQERKQWAATKQRIFADPRRPFLDRQSPHCPALTEPPLPARDPCTAVHPKT